MQLITGGIGASNCDLGTCDRRTRTVGVVGESGCGKTTPARCILRLIEPTTGEVFFDGTDALTLSPEKLGELRRDMQIIFQNPHSSLDPRMSVFRIVGEPLRTHTSMSHGRSRDRVVELLEQEAWSRATYIAILTSSLEGSCSASLLLERWPSIPSS